MAKRRSLVLYAAIGMATVPCASSAKPISDKEAQQIAKEAYVYGVPMVTVYSTLYEFSVDKGNPHTRARSIPS